MPSTPLSLIASTLVAGLAAISSSVGCAGGAPKPSANAAEQQALASPPSPHVEERKPVAESLDHFIPGGWVVLAKGVADLDRDGQRDVVALVEHERGGKSVDGYSMPSSRYVLVVVQDEPSPRLSAMNRAILRTKNALDTYGPNVQLDAAHGEFSITQSGGTSSNRWSYTLSFQHHRTRSGWFLASCSFETDSTDVRGRARTSTGSHAYSYTVEHDFGHFDRGQFDGFCPQL